MTFTPTVTRVVPEYELRWIDRLLIPGPFDSEHIFEVETLRENTVKFFQCEQFRGLLVPLLWRSLESNTRQGFIDMNAALKKAAEKEETWVGSNL